MRAGRLDRRIVIQQQGAASDDGLRSMPSDWEDIGKRWAMLVPQTSVERLSAAENAAVQTLRFRVRRDALTRTLNPALHRIGYRGGVYDLQGVAEVDRDAFDLTVTGRADGADPQ